MKAPVGTGLPRLPKNPTMRAVVERFEVMDDRMAQVLREKSGAERLRIGDQMFSFARDLIADSVRAAHPQWDEGRIAKETARRLSHGAV